MNYIVVPLEKLDVHKITFGKAKENQYKRTNIPLYYKREDKDVHIGIYSISHYITYGFTSS